MTGFFQHEASTASIAPPWLSGIRCTGSEADVGACRRSSFGDTRSCMATQRLFCLSSRVLLPHMHAQSHHTASCTIPRPSDAGQLFHAKTAMCTWLTPCICSHRQRSKPRFKKGHSLILSHTCISVKQLLWYQSSCLFTATLGYTKLAMWLLTRCPNITKRFLHVTLDHAQRHRTPRKRPHAMVPEIVVLWCVCFCRAHVQGGVSDTHRSGSGGIGWCRPGQRPGAASRRQC